MLSSKTNQWIKYLKQLRLFCNTSYYFSSVLNILILINMNYGLFLSKPFHILFILLTQCNILSFKENNDYKNEKTTLMLKK